MTRARRRPLLLMSMLIVAACTNVLYISVIDVQLVVDAVTTTITSVSASASTSASSNRSSLSSSLLLSTSSSLSPSLLLRRPKRHFPQQQQQQQLYMNNYQNQSSHNRKSSSSSLDLLLHHMSRGGGDNEIMDNIGSEIRYLSKICKTLLRWYTLMCVGVIWFHIGMDITGMTEDEFTILSLYGLCVGGVTIILLDLSLTLVEKVIVSRRHRHQQQQRSNRDSVLNIIHTSKAVLSVLYFVKNIVKRRKKTQRRTSYSDANNNSKIA